MKDTCCQIIKLLCYSEVLSLSPCRERSKHGIRVFELAFLFIPFIFVSSALDYYMDSSCKTMPKINQSFGAICALCCLDSTEEMGQDFLCSSLLLLHGCRQSHATQPLCYTYELFL